MVELRRGEATPKALGEKLESPLSHVSLALKELSERGLVECLNPLARKGRRYVLTTEGTKLLDEVARLARPSRS